MNISQVEIEIGDNLYLRISDVTLTAGRPARISGRPEDCYPEDPAEIEWKYQHLIRYSKYNGKPVELSSGLDDNVANDYYDELLDQALENVAEEHSSRMIEKYENDLLDKTERILFGGNVKC